MNKKRKQENAKIEKAMKAKQAKRGKPASKQAPKVNVDLKVIEEYTARKTVQGVVKDAQGKMRPGTYIEVVDGLDPSNAGKEGLRAIITKRPKNSAGASLLGECNLEIRDAQGVLQGGTNGTLQECRKLAKAFGVPEASVELLHAKQAR